MSEISPQSFSRPKYRADIDGMRALAILAVLIFHAYPSSLPGGFVGVDIFFVISGYLISSIIFRGLTLGTFSFFDFYARRIRRIFPAVTVVLLSSFVFGIFFVSPYVLEGMIRESPYAAFFIENIRLFLKHGEYWDVGTELKPFMHFWSLGVEEQYYIFYPLICYFLWKVNSKIFLSCLLGLLLLSFGWCLYDTANEPIRAFYMLHTRFWELLVGGVLAYIEVNWPNYKEKLSNSLFDIEKLNNLMSIVGLVLIVIAIAYFEESHPFPGWRALLPTLGAVLIIMAGSESLLNKRIFANKASVFIGLISYPLYLWHWPLISIVRNNLGGRLPTGVLMVTIVLLSFIFAYLTYTLIERPMRSKKATWRLVLVLVLVMAISTLGTKELIRKNKVLETWMLSNQTEETRDVRTEYYSFEPYDSECIKTLGKGFHICQKRGDQPNTIVFGDSHAILLWNYLRSNQSEPLYLVGNHGAVIFENVLRLKEDDAELHKLTHQFWDSLRQTPELEIIVLFGYWANYLDKEMISKTNPKWNKEEVFRNHWHETFKELKELNKKVIVVLDNPTVPENYKYCLTWKFQRINLGDKDETLCMFDSKEVSDEERLTRQILQEEASKWPNVKIVDAQAKLCLNGRCQVFREGLQLYRDDDHLSPFGYRFVWPEIDERIKEFEKKRE